MQYIQSLCAGLLISLSGSLPLGNLNIAALQIAAKETVSRALWFSVGVVIAEVFYLGVILATVGKLAIGEKALFFFQVLSVVVLIVMSAGSFIATGHKDGSNIVLRGGSKRWYLGLAMSALNPMQIPFWAGWVVYLFSRSLIADSFPGFTLFALSAGMGTFIALLVFIFAGKRFSVVMLERQKLINTLIGCLFAAMAVFQIFKLWKY